MRRAVLLLALLFSAVNAALAQDEESVVSVAEEPRLLEPTALEGFLDGYMAAYLEDANVAGATLAVIEGDAVVLAKGYGFADVESHSPVDPEKTLFRIGSVSKLFVWTAVMQLVDRGLLALDTDVNGYLEDFQIPERDGAPVTMAQLMTHTAGFDERVLGLFARDESALRPLGEIVRDELPARIRPGDDLISYSNHGTGLAMYIVEQITGTDWSVYLESNILEPLGLDTTSFAQPLPTALTAHMSKGYRFQGGDFVERPFEFVPLAAVGAAASSATDMARFMAAHLGLGETGGVRILSEEASRRMQSSLFRPHPEVNGMAHGFMEMDRNGVRVIGHGGDTELFHTLFAFLPEHDIGLFASFNTVGADYDQLLQAFIDWRFPVDVEVDSAREGVDTELERFTGRYRPTRYPHRTIAKLAALLSTIEIREDDGALVTDFPDRTRWVPVGPLLFRADRETHTLAFRENGDGEITHVFASQIPVIAFERAPVTETPTVAGASVFGGTFVALVVLLFWPAAFLVRRHYRVKLPREGRIPAFTRWTLWAASLALVTFSVSLALLLAEPMDVVFGLPSGADLLFWLPSLAALLAVLALSGAYRALRSGRGTFLGCLCFSLACVALLVAVWQLSLWNLAWPSFGS
jgi:CubicO group peptidase (beta-lactamase class C family)